MKEIFLKKKSLKNIIFISALAQSPSNWLKLQNTGVSPDWIGTLCLVCVADDHSRVKLKSEVNVAKKDYINASFIVRTTHTALIWPQLVGRKAESGRLWDDWWTSQMPPAFTVLLLAPSQSLLSCFFSSSSTRSSIMTLVSRRTLPPRDPWLTLWLISGRSAHRPSLLFSGAVHTL